MKKTRFIAIALVVAIMLMGAGYAYWNDTLTIDNTVSTGEFDVRFINFALYSSYDNYQSNATFWNNRNEWIQNRIDNFVNRWFTGADEDGPLRYDSNNYVETNADFEIETNGDGDNAILFELNNVYPGSGGFLIFGIVNNGDVPAKLKDITPEFFNGEYLKDEFRYSIGEVRLMNNTAGFKILHDGINEFNTFNDFILGLTELLSVDENGNEIILMPGDLIFVNCPPAGTYGTTIAYDIYLREDATETTSVGDFATEAETYKFDLNLNLTQWNAQD